MATLREEMMSKMKGGSINPSSTFQKPNLRQEMLGAMKNTSGKFTVTSRNDSKCCPDCSSRNGKSFASGSPRPPFHPNCRCTAH